MDTNHFLYISHGPAYQYRSFSVRPETITIVILNKYVFNNGTLTKVMRNMLLCYDAHHLGKKIIIFALICWPTSRRILLAILQLLLSFVIWDSVCIAIVVGCSIGIEVLCQLGLIIWSGTTLPCVTICGWTKWYLPKWLLEN